MKHDDHLNSDAVKEAEIPEPKTPATKNADKATAPRHTSVRQIEANRRNALRSTGPTTPQGKQASRLNAVRHGLRAKDAIIPGQEDPEELEAILGELSEDWQPEGHTEIQLVEQIGLAEWRLRRVYRAELGEIRKQVLPASDLKTELQQAHDHCSMQLQELVVKGAAGIAYLRTPVQDALDELERTGLVSEDSCLYIGMIFSKMQYNPGPELRIWFLGETPEEYENEKEDPNSELRPWLRMNEAEKAEAARELLKMTLKDLDCRERKLLEQERTDFEIARQRLSIPQGPELERIQRYETTIKRDMYRAIDQLERMQRRRRGEPQAPTLNVKISNDN